VLEVEQHVRALLRDVLCGYLSADLKGAADDILLASSEEIEIRARDLRQEAEAEAEAEAELEPVAEQPPRRPAAQPAQTELDAGVTPSADWEYDDDPSSYSAPI
jgi:hypothetical protein